MKGSKILERKLDKLNVLKGRLTENSFRDREKVVEDIKETVEDLEIILLDLEYMKEEDKEVNIDRYRTYRSFRDYDTFTEEDVNKYNGVDGMPVYIEVDGKVYDVSDKAQVDGVETVEGLKRFYENNKELLEDCVQVGVLEN